MPSITFVGVELKNVVRTAKEATFHFSAEYTAKVAKHFQWGDPSDSDKKADKDGALAGGSMALTPKDAKQKAFEGTRPDVLEVALATCGKFKITRLQTEGSKGKGTRRRIDFVATSIDGDAAMKAEKWLQLAAKIKAELCCDYRVKDSGAPGEGDAVDMSGGETE